MADQMITCRVCGKQYKACNSVRKGSTVFNWREFACSPECGKKYLAQIENTRSKKTEPKFKHKGVRVQTVDLAKTEVVAETSDSSANTTEE